jgi:hypothetical protein
MKRWVLILVIAGLVVAGAALTVTTVSNCSKGVNRQGGTYLPIGTELPTLEGNMTINYIRII